MPEGIMSPREWEAAREMEKQREVKVYLDGLKAMLADPDLPKEERADIKEQIAGLKDSLAEAEASGRSIYTEKK